MHFPEPLEVQAREAAAAGDDARAAELREELAQLPLDRRIACHVRQWSAEEQASDPEARATIASYLFGYAMKGIANAQDEKDDAARGAVWAGQRRIRRWAILGARRGLIGQWEAIYRKRERPADATLAAVWDAMRAQHWGDALELMGAFGPTADAPMTWDYDERRRKDGTVGKVPMALRAANVDIATLTEADVIMVRIAGQRWTRTSASAWATECELRVYVTAPSLAVSDSSPSAPAGAGATGVPPADRDPAEGLRHFFEDVLGPPDPTDPPEEQWRHPEDPLGDPDCATYW